MLVWNAGAALNIASGLLMAALGAALLLANPRKDWNRVFALLATFWGAQIIASNAVRVTTDEGVARLAGGLGLAFLIPLYFFFVVFAAIFPRPRAPFGTSSLGLGLLALPAAGALAVLFASPESLVAAVRPAPDGVAFTLLWGPLVPYLLAVPFFGGVLYALFTMMQRLEEAPSAIERKQITFVLAALALFMAHTVPGNLVAFAGLVPYLGGATEAAPAEATVFALVLVGGLALLGVLAAKLLTRLRAAEAPERESARIVLAALALGFFSAIALIAVAALGGPDVEAIGLVRSGSVALVVYAVARYQLFDLDLRVKSLAAAGTAALAVGALAVAGWLALRQAALPEDVGSIAAAVVALLAFVPVLRASSRLVDRVAPAVSRDGEHLYLRKLEVYRASVEELLREGRTADPAEAGLVEQRHKLGLSERDHGIVVSLAATRAEPRGATPDLRPGGVAFGKYAIDSLLAEGGFGRVFLARDRVLDRPVVIKELLAKWRGNPSVVRTFLREAQIAGQLSHPNIVAVHDVEQHGQDSYVVMEYCPGGTLADRLRDGSLAPAEALRIAQAVLDGLGAAHGRGVVHRDVKPENILFGARGEVKLADFGIATLAEDDPQRTISGLTTARFQPGTLQYMSPEQARGAPVDARSDLYAVGAVLHRMLTGKHHLDLQGLDELAARNRIAEAPPPANVAGLPDPLNAALRRALARDPAQRFASARAFAEALAEVSLSPGKAASR